MPAPRKRRRRLFANAHEPILFVPMLIWLILLSMLFVFVLLADSAVIMLKRIAHAARCIKADDLEVCED